MCRKIFGLFLLLIMIFALTVCAVSCDMLFATDTSDSADDGDDTTDTDVGDGDATEVDTSLYLPITSGSEPVITVVSAYSKSAELSAMFKAFTDKFKAVGINFRHTYSASDDPDAAEIIIGDRLGAPGDAYVDPHELGDEGYAIRVVGNRIVIAGGSDASLVRALDIFIYEVLNLDDPSTDLENVAVDRSTDIYKRQTYPISSVTVGGNDLAGYDIVTNMAIDDLVYCAEELQSALYNRAGYWLDVKRSTQRPAIRINLVDYAGYDGFRAYVAGDDLIIECAYPILLKDTFDEFIDERISNASGAVAFDGAYTIKISELCYSAYGAVGDGVTDDFEAIKATHMRANVTGQKVVAEQGKTYYLGQHADSITVKTDVDWTGATFIIDDSNVSPTSLVKSYNVFNVKSDTTPYAVSGITTLSKGQANIGVTLDEPVLLYIRNDNKMQYIRYGANADNGAPQQEIILVDKDGNVDPSTPIMWDYDTLTSVYAYSVTDKPITITGGTFVTIANAATENFTYYNRGIGISRSNVTIDGITHTITGEGETGAPYNGFLAVSYTHNVTVKNSVLTGHKTYTMGTYDISMTLANQVTYLNCRQTNSIIDTTYWGIMGSNYCKNLTYDGCVFSRFDAHKGTHNATIKNSEIGHQKLSVIGSGTLLIENTTIHGNIIVNLRNDYGSTWEGDIIIKDVTLKNTGNVTLLQATWYNHYFGYTCHLPTTVTVDGLTLQNNKQIYIYTNLRTGIDTDTVGGEENVNRIVLTEKIIMKNIPDEYTYTVSQNMTLFANVELVKE